MSKMITFEYGAMSSKYSLKAENKLTAYATMVYHFGCNNHLIAIYSPEEYKQDQWLNLFGVVSERLHEVFGGIPEDYPENDAFDKYVDEHIEEIKACYNTIEQII